VPSLGDGASPSSATSAIRGRSTGSTSSTASCEATFVLDGLLYHDAPPIEEHYTDTEGFTDLVFGLCTILGKSFAPRLRDLPDQALYRARRDGDYGRLNPLLGQSARTELIARHWDDLNRLAASLKDGLATPSLIVSRLQAMQRRNPLQQASRKWAAARGQYPLLSYTAIRALNSDWNSRRTLCASLAVTPVLTHAGPE
jgi:TnpA family transposase